MSRYASEPPKADFASAGGHWYDGLTGEPRYTIIGKNGKERNTTLRDARANGWYPSVTGIIRLAAAPGLEKWKRNQVLLAALTLPRRDGENETDWLRRVEQDWQEQGRAAADRGTLIHGAIEKHYRREVPDEEFWPHVVAAKDEIASRCGEQNWHAERSFGCPMGYGGKTDLHSAEWVIDVKTKDGELPTELYDEHLMQMAAYRRGLGVPRARCGILFVSREKPAAALVEAPEPDLVRALTMFDALLSYWQAVNSYYPQQQAVAA